MSSIQVTGRVDGQKCDFVLQGSANTVRRVFLEFFGETYPPFTASVTLVSRAAGASMVS